MNGMAKVEHDNLTFLQLIENIGFWGQPTRLPPACQRHARWATAMPAYMAMAGRSPTAAAFVRSALFGIGGQVYAGHMECWSTGVVGTKTGMRRKAQGKMFFPVRLVP